MNLICVSLKLTQTWCDILTLHRVTIPRGGVANDKVPNFAAPVALP